MNHRVQVDAICVSADVLNTTLPLHRVLSVRLQVIEFDVARTSGGLLGEMAALNFDWHVLAHRRCSGFLATPAGSIVSADLVYRHGGNWQEDAAKNAALRELVEEAGLQLDSSVAGHFFTLAKDTTLINQKFQDRFGKVHGVGACEKLHVPVRLF